MSGELGILALRRFESFYERLDDAIDARDIDAISELVAQRTAVVEQLVATYAGTELPDDIRGRLIEREEALRESLMLLQDEIEAALVEQRRRGAAVLRYTRGR